MFFLFLNDKCVYKNKPEFFLSKENACIFVCVLLVSLSLPHIDRTNVLKTFRNDAIELHIIFSLLNGIFSLFELGGNLNTPI